MRPRSQSLLLSLILTASAVLGTAAVQAKTFVIPHVLEQSGKISNTQFTFDTTMFITYSGGIGDTLNGGGANVDLFLFDEATGSPMRSASGEEVCNPCSISVGASNRKVSVSIEDLITAKGGFDHDSKTGFGVVVVGGADPDGVSVQGFVVNSHTSAFDLSVFGFDPVPLPAAARVFVLPHVLERAGTINNTQFTFDTTIFATYVGGLPGVPGSGGANLDLYLYDQSSAPLRNNGADVCNPCTFQLDQVARKQSIRIDDLIAVHGAFDQAVKLGFGVIVVGGADPANVGLSGFVVNSHSSPLDLAVYGFKPQPLPSSLGGTQNARTFVLPHVLEKSGTINNTQFTFDTTIFATYAGGLPGIPGTGGAALNFYLYDQSGAPMKGLSTKDVCNPCTFQLDSAARKQSIRIDDLIVNNGGGFDSEVKLGYGVLVVGGADPDNVNLQGFVVNSHTSAFDVQMHDPGPYPLESSRGGGGGSGGLTSKTFVLPHVLERSGTINTTQYTFDTTIFADYTAGQAGTPDGPGATIDLYLLDQNGAAVLQNNGGPVCDPCSFPLGRSERKQSIRIDDLIAAQGGFDQNVKLGYGVVVVRGDADNVNLQGFVVNSHTSALDLSTFGFEPVPLGAELAPQTLPLLVIDGLVSGPTGGDGVTLSLTGAETRSILTDASGHYTFFVSSNANYTVTPSLTGQSFLPASASFTPLIENQSASFSMSPALTLSDPGFSGGAFTVWFQTIMGGRYSLEVKDALGVGSWSSVVSATGDGTINRLSDTNAPTALRFYRVRQD